MAKPTMTAVRIHQYGGPEVLTVEDAPRPQIGPDEVLIHVHASGVNPVDWKARAGHLQGFIDYTLPFIPGWDVSGIVAESGDAVTEFRVGDAVYSRPDIARDGTYAEYVAVKASEVAPKPKTLDHIQAAGVPLAALTAWQVLFDVAKITPGQTVLVQAAAGGVGTFAVQLAKWKGAHVIGTASGRNADFLRELGVDEVVDYTAGPFEEAVYGVDVVFDTMAGEIQDRSWAVLKPGGIQVSILTPPSEEKAAQVGARAGYVFVQPNATQLSEIAALIDAGTVRPIIDTVLPLTEARRAQELSAEGHARGKIILQVI